MKMSLFSLSALALISTISLANAAGSHDHASDAARTMHMTATTPPTQVTQQNKPTTTAPVLSERDQLMLRRKASSR